MENSASCRLEIMKRTVLIGFFGCFLIISVSLSSADANEVLKTFPAGGAADVLNQKGPPGADDKPIGAIKLEKKCRDDKGNLISEGNKGYEECLKLRLKRPKRSPIPEAPSEDEMMKKDHSSKVKPATK